MCIQRPYLDNLHKLANSAEDLYNAGLKNKGGIDE
jgi:hypothetical protein